MSTMPSIRDHARTGAILTGRLLQFIFAGIAIILIAGSFLGNANVVVFVVAALLALVLLGLVGVMELLAIRPLRRRGGA